MPRPLLIDGKLPMKIFENRGYRYVVTRTSQRKADGKYNHPQKIWGTIDEELNFHPNLRFLSLSEPERSAMRMPPEWKIARDGAVPIGRGRPSYSGACSSLLYGHTWFLDMLADRSGLRDDLVHVFEDREIADSILTMAYYSLVEGSSYSHLAGEQKISWFPASSPIESWTASRLISSITEDNRQALFRCRRARTDSNSWLAVDSTSITHYGKGLADSKRGKNKEHDPADQINVLVVYDITRGAPVYYRRMPGNIPDTRTMRVTLKELEDGGFGKVNLILDRGYVSEEVITMFVRKKHPFVMMARTCDRQIAKAIAETDSKEMTRYTNWIDSQGLYGKVLNYCFELDVKGEKRKVNTVKLCLFFDPELQGERRKEISGRAAEMARHLENMMEDGDVAESETLAGYSQYFDIELNANGTVKSYAMNERKMDASVAKAGYFAVLASSMPGGKYSPEEILNLYGMRDEQEKSFLFVKSEQDGRRFRTSKESAADGRLFVQFVALILNCQIYRGFLASEKLQNLFPTRQHMLEELKAIRLISHPLRAKIITEIVGRQIDIFREFHLQIPLYLLPKDRRQEYVETITGKK